MKLRIPIQYINPGFVCHLEKSAWDLIYPADFWNTQGIKEIWLVGLEEIGIKKHWLFTENQNPGLVFWEYIIWAIWAIRTLYFSPRYDFYSPASIAFALSATLYVCFMPCLIQLFFEKFLQNFIISLRNFSKNNRN